MIKQLFPDPPANAHYLSRVDDEEILGSYYPHSFELENQQWPTIEHYYQAMKFDNISYQEKIRQAQTPARARRLGRTRFKKIRKNWREVRAAFMTRAIYTACHTYPYLAQSLLQTNPQTLVENAQYDYYWGCGRDRLGTNMYGQVLMRVRDKLCAEQSG
ncbi:MAG: NADAR family protein [Pseudomonadales bacterium]|nr:NADAR family protein [Pseudomonadales bacterium]